MYMFRESFSCQTDLRCQNKKVEKDLGYFLYLCGWGVELCLIEV